MSFNLDHKNSINNFMTKKPLLQINNGFIFIIPILLLQVVSS